MLDDLNNWTPRTAADIALFWMLCEVYNRAALHPEETETAAQLGVVSTLRDASKTGYVAAALAGRTLGVFNPQGLGALLDGFALVIEQVAEVPESPGTKEQAADFILDLIDVVGERKAAQLLAVWTKKRPDFPAFQHFITFLEEATTEPGVTLG